MSNIIIYSCMDNKSKSFAEANKSSVDYIFDWYKDDAKREIYLANGNPQPSGFPSVAINGFIVRNPASMEDAKAKINKKITQQKVRDDALLWVAKNEHGVFSKLQIRRGLRALGDEAKLDALLNASPEFKSDWSDASEIDLNDEMTQAALEQSDIDIEALKDIVLNGR